MLVEGERPLREALRAGARIDTLLVDSSISEDSPAYAVAQQFIEAGHQVIVVDARILAPVFETKTPQGIVGIVSVDETPVGIRELNAPLVLILDRVRDPGNMGTLVRSAHGAGFDAVLVAPESADPFSPKVVRAAMGSHFHLPVHRATWDEIIEITDGVTRLIADAHASVDYVDVNWRSGAALIIGNETLGASKAAFDAANAIVGIPLAKSLESLNAAIAGSVIMFEAARQRRKG